MELQAGQSISHYRLIEKIGSGGMGVVWSAQDTKRKRQVAILAIHGRLLAEDGGPSGAWDESLLESALAAPMNHFEYDKADVFVLASTYAHALIRNPPFYDGNKRTAWAAVGSFLELNVYRLTASEPDSVLAVLALSKGEMNAEEFCQWLRISSAWK